LAGVSPAFIESDPTYALARINDDRHWKVLSRGFSGNADAMSKMHNDGKVEGDRLGNPQWFVPGTVRDSMEK
jgi:hypothetical protein